MIKSIMKILRYELIFLVGWCAVTIFFHGGPTRDAIIISISGSISVILWQLIKSIPIFNRKKEKDGNK